MIVRDHGDGGCWYVHAVSFPTSLMAKRAWELTERKLDLANDDRGIGITRLSPDPLPEPNAMRTGAPERAHVVALVTLHEPTAHKAQRLLSSGVEFEPTLDFADALIMRRARVVHEHAGERGRMVVRRPEGRGAPLHKSGKLDEPEPGRG